MNYQNLPVYKTVAFLFLAFIPFVVNAQFTGGDSINCGRKVTIVVLGSSTAVGTGASPLDSSWVKKLTAYVKSKNPSSTVINLAAGGYTTYQVLRPSNYVAPSNRPKPDKNKNITKALTYNPDLIIINLPSNDAAAGYSLQEQKNNYEAAMALAASKNIPVWITTTQPRNGMSSANMTNLKSMKDWTFQRFNEKAIDFWTTLATSSGTIVSSYGSGDGVHLNNKGHGLILKRVIAERLLDSICLRKNMAPSAQAGPDLQVSLPQGFIQLNGTGSHDPDGTIAKYSWKKISNSGFTITDPQSPISFISNVEPGEHKVELTVTDNYGKEDRDTLVIHAIFTGPLAPVADAGRDTTLFMPLTSYEFNGSSSYDPDGTIDSYQWNVITLPPSVSFHATGPNVILSNLATGSCMIEMLITDNDGLTSRDTITITILPKPNQFPVCIAGDDIVIYHPAQETSLDGSASFDPDGLINVYQWKLVSGPFQPFIDDSFAISPLISNLSTGHYIFELTVTDNEGASSKDSLELIVLPPPNQIPVAASGPDIEITLPVDSVRLDASTSYDTDGTIVKYEWKKLEGPSSHQLSDIASPSPLVTNLLTGEYIFELTVADDRHGVSTDQVKITVLRGPNRPPVAHAGADQVLTGPGQPLQLHGNLSVDPDHFPLSYLWEKIEGPSGAAIANPLLASTTVSQLVVGNYRFRLSVTDDSLALDSDTVNVTVLPAAEKSIQVNVYGGSQPAGTGWNNWNVQSSLSMSSLKYSDGTSSVVSVSLSSNAGISDNGSTYPVTMCPAPVGRTTSYSTSNRTLTISGLDNQKTYTLELYSSRDNTGNSTTFTSGSKTGTVLSSRNYAKAVTLTGLIPQQRKITVSIARVNTYNYLNGFILTETETQPAARSMVSDDPSDIQQIQEITAYPNPFRENVTMKMDNDYRGRFSIEIFNMSGKKIHRIEATKQEDLWINTYKIPGLVVGVYLAVFEMGDQRRTVRLIRY